jgi:hypothetical protein
MRARPSQASNWGGLSLVGPVPVLAPGRSELEGDFPINKSVDWEISVYQEVA